MNSKEINIEYFAQLKEERGASKEKFNTTAITVEELFKELKAKHGLTLNQDICRAAINNKFVDWSESINNNDTVIFVPPVSGG